MADLPDIDTSQVSFIGYWNAIDDGGVPDIDPSEVTSDSSVISYDAYDNGVEGEYSLLDSNTATFRVKNDGWFVLYKDRTETFDTETEAELPGPWDVMYRWAEAEVATELQQNAFDYAMQSLQSELSNSGSITFNFGDTGLYNYEYPNATNTSLFNANPGDGGGGSFRFSYTSNTDIKWAVATARHDDDANSFSGSTSFVGDTSVTLTDTSQLSGSFGVHTGVVDLLGQGLIPNSGTEYGHDLNATTNQQYSADALFVWS